MAKNSLPPHIRQWVDKNNFVIAIKTLSQEQGISLEAAKAQIDAYEASKNLSSTSLTPAVDQTADKALLQSVDKHLKQKNSPSPLLPYWVKRIAVVLAIIALLSGLLWQVFVA